MLDVLQNILIYGGSFLLVLGLVVFVHEFGHFQAARWSKVAIDTFSIGFGKTIGSWRDRQGVIWKIGALPLGGYVKFQDDADPTSAAPNNQFPEPHDSAAREEARRRGLFHAQPVGVRAFVVAAGPFANFIFSILAFALVFMAIGKDVTNREALAPRVDAVQAGSAAAAAGLQPNDIVRAVDGQTVESWGALQKAVDASQGRPLRLLVERNGATLTLAATPVATEALGPAGERITRYVLGVQRGVSPEERRIVQLNPLQAVGEGARQVWTIISTTVGYIANIFTGKASAEHIAGPAGILDMSGQVAKGAWGEGSVSLPERISDLALGLLFWAATLSVAVGFMNLLPVPVLDGGHLVFYGIEAARGGKPLPPRAQEFAFRAGIAALASLFLIATWNDLNRLFSLSNLFG